MKMNNKMDEFFFDEAFLSEADSPFKFDSQPAPPIATDERPKELSYKPKHTRGDGPSKEALCETCNKWFKLKTSSYWYHMHYKHGISANGRVCPEPVTRNRNYKVEGYCKECKEWIVLGVAKRGARFGWYRHWQRFHCKSRSI